MRIVDGLARRIGWVVVEVKGLHGLGAHHLEPFKGAAAFKGVVNVTQEAGFGVSALDGNAEGRANTPDDRVAAPHLDLGDHPHRFSQFNKGSVSFGCGLQFDGVISWSPCRRCCHALAANLSQHVHLTLGLLQSGLALGYVVDDPWGKTNGTFDGHPMVFNALSQVFQGPASFNKGVETIKPRFHRVVARFASDFDFLLDPQFLSTDGTGVQAVAKDATLRALGLLQTGLRGGDRCGPHGHA